MDFTNLGVMRAPRHLVFGAGQRGALARHAGVFGTRALIVTDTRMARDKDFLQMRQALEAQGIATQVFDGVAAELPLSCIEAGAKAGRAAGARMIIGIGGGSCLDAAKIIGLLLSHGGAPQDYYGEYKVPGPIMPLILLPTTSGTGSEVTPVAVLDDPQRAMKIGIASPHLIPEVAICDPELTLSCPPGLTAASGADAMTHAIEAFTTLRRPADSGLSLDHVFIGKNAISDSLALEAIRLIAANLARCVSHGDDLEARSAMMLGSTLAGLAFGVAGTAAAHAIQYPVGAMTHTAHGLGVATLMPYVMAWNRPSCETDFARIGAAMGLAASGDTSRQAEAAIAAIAALFAQVGIPATIAQLGVPEDRLDEIARLALSAERLIKNNPRMLDAEGMDRIVRAAHSGDLDLLTATSPRKAALQ